VLTHAFMTIDRQTAHELPFQSLCSDCTPKCGSSHSL